MIAKILFTVAVAAIARFVIKGYQVRKLVRDLSEKHGIPILPHSWIFGHLIVVAKVAMKYPQNASGTNVPRFLMLEYPELCKAGLIYFDTWPMGYPILAAFHPDLLAQFCQTPSRPKHEWMEKEFRDFTDAKDLVSLEGAEWKRWRSIFNPGFSAQNIASLVPAFVEETLVFRNHLISMAARGEQFRLEDQAMKATADIIGRAVLGERLCIQSTESRLWSALKDQIAQLLFTGRVPLFLQENNPLRYIKLWNNNRILRDVITPYIRKQLSDPDTAGGPKTVNSLAIRAYLAETVKSKEADDAFVENALAHLKIFLLAGHDTTGTTLCWVYYRLHRNPRVAQKVRAELNSVFGTKVSLTADQIKEDPSLLNRLTYTSAVLKETLRMYPPVSSVRGGSPDFFLIHPETHQKYPTDGFMMLSSSHSVHRNEDYWPQPDEFIPERWISENGDPVNPVSNKSAYRPFELGPRNCIGQELALTELRLILALTVREFNILPQYSKKDEKVFGEPIYQADLPGEITAHISGGMPVKVQLTAAFA